MMVQLDFMPRGPVSISRLQHTESVARRSSRSVRREAAQVAEDQAEAQWLESYAEGLLQMADSDRQRWKSLEACRAAVTEMTGVFRSAVDTVPCWLVLLAIASDAAPPGKTRLQFCDFTARLCLAPNAPNALHAMRPLEGCAGVLSLAA